MRFRDFSEHCGLCSSQVRMGKGLGGGREGVWRKWCLCGNLYHWRLVRVGVFLSVCFTCVLYHAEYVEDLVFIFEVPYFFIIWSFKVYGKWISICCLASDVEILVVSWLIKCIMSHKLVKSMVMLDKYWYKNSMLMILGISIVIHIITYGLHMVHSLQMLDTKTFRVKFICRPTNLRHIYSVFFVMAMTIISDL